AETASSITFAKVAGVHGWSPGLSLFHQRDAESPKNGKGASDRALFVGSPHQHLLTGGSPHCLPMHNVYYARFRRMDTPHFRMHSYCRDAARVALDEARGTDPSKNPSPATSKASL